MSHAAPMSCSSPVRRFPLLSLGRLLPVPSPLLVAVLIVLRLSLVFVRPSSCRSLAFGLSCFPCFSSSPRSPLALACAVRAGASALRGRWGALAGFPLARFPCLVQVPLPGAVWQLALRPEGIGSPAKAGGMPLVPCAPLLAPRRAGVRRSFKSSQVK